MVTEYIDEGDGGNRGDELERLGRVSVCLTVHAKGPEGCSYRRDGGRDGNNGLTV